jgi:hypothetical protein
MLCYSRRMDAHDEALLNATEHGDAAGKGVPPEVRAKLRRDGMVGKNGGLTRAGRIARDRKWRDALDDAFGPL